MKRRGFFAMVVGASLAGRMGVSPAPHPTEEEFIRYLEDALSLPIPPQNIYVSPNFRWLLKDHQDAISMGLYNPTASPLSGLKEKPDARR